MADIIVKDIYPISDIKARDISSHNVSGADLFSDSEDFMTELNDEQEQNIFGGMRCTPVETCYYSMYA
jgi:hypothetical protein